MALEARQFLRDGQLEHLRRAAEHAENVGGWAVALPWAVRYLMLAPTDGGGAFHLLLLLRDANQYWPDETGPLGFRSGKPLPHHSLDLCRRAAPGKPARPAQRPAILDTIRERAPLREVQAFIEGLRAQASEALGDYRRPTATMSA